METKAHIHRAISLLGGPVKAAEALGVARYQTVQQWVLSGSIPAEYCPRIEEETGGQVRCEDLRPSVDWGFIRRSKSRRKTAHGVA